MINCRNCGVELDERMNFCPLCGAPVFIKDPDKREKLIKEKTEVSTRLKTEIATLDKTQKTKFFWEITSIIVAASIIPAVALNIIVNSYLSWSLYVLVGCLTVFAYITVLSFIKNGWAIMLSLFFINSIALIFIDLIDYSVEWSVKLGIPALASVCMILAGVILAIRHTPEKGFNIIAYFFLASAILSAAVDILITLYVENRFHLSWSVIVFVATLPVAFILLYIHYKLRRGTDLRKFFHI